MLKTIAVLAYMLGHTHPDATPFEVHSAVIQHYMIPKTYTCFGQDKTLPINWSGAPHGTKSLALMLEDIDAPGGVRYHWVVYNISPRQHSINLAVNNNNQTRQGLNSWNQASYMSPCPPSGEHRYVLHLYALDKKLHLSRDELAKPHVIEAHMRGHVIAETQKLGLYDKKLSG